MNRKSDGLLSTAEPPSPPNNRASKMSNNSLSPKSPQLMDSDSDDVGDSDHNSHPTGKKISFHILIGHFLFYELKFQLVIIVIENRSNLI
jgi:hypothetical protein